MAKDKIVGRRVIVMDEKDGRERYIHAVVLSPFRCSEEDALDGVTSAFDAAVEANPDAWNYDEVFAELEKRGFMVIDHLTWTE